MPTKTPLNAVIHGKVERPDYTVEKGYFESAPGFFYRGMGRLRHPEPAARRAFPRENWATGSDAPRAAG